MKTFWEHDGLSRALSGRYNAPSVCSIIIIIIITII